MTTYENMAAIAAERTCDRETDAHTQDAIDQNPFEQNYLELMALYEAANYLQAAIQENVNGIVSMDCHSGKAEIHILSESFDRLFAGDADLKYDDWPAQQKVCISKMVDGAKVYCLKKVEYVRVFE